MKKSEVKVIVETKTGLNRIVSIDGTKYTNVQAYYKAKKGDVPGFCGVNNNGTKYIRSNPDDSTKNNLD